MVEVFNLEAIETNRVIVVIVVIDCRFRLILFEDIVSCIHRVVVAVTSLVVTGIGRYSFDSVGRETAIVIKIIVVVILFLIGKEIEPGVVVAIIVGSITIQTFDLGRAFIGAFVRAFVIMIR
jgi:hypothetical protein